MPSLRARDVHQKLNNRIDPVLLEVICQIAEEQHAISRAIPEMAKSFEGLVKVLHDNVHIMNTMAASVTGLQKRVGDVKSLGTDEG